MNELLKEMVDFPVEILGVIVGAKPDKPAAMLRFSSSAATEKALPAFKKAFCKCYGRSEEQLIVTINLFASEIQIKTA